MDIQADLGADTQPMRRALALCLVIAPSKLVRDAFSAVVTDCLSAAEMQEGEADGSMNWPPINRMTLTTMRKVIGPGPALSTSHWAMAP